nr:MAG TPA_asm: hypothetical protein [Caudoviricetes sp.]
MRLRLPPPHKAQPRGFFPPSTAIRRLCCARTRFIKALWRRFP